MAIANKIYKKAHQYKPKLNDRELSAWLGFDNHCSVSKAKRDDGVAIAVAEALARKRPECAYLVDEAKAELKVRQARGVAKRNRARMTEKQFCIKDLPPKLHAFVGYIG